ncbi:MAG TPA: chromate transporter, partial [Ktedonobacterales bacterium]|nr:chromate transporter [Ktedonobacterales bacterium]
VQALWGLGRTALKGTLALVVGLLILGLYLLGVNELALLFGGAALFALLRLIEQLARRRNTPTSTNTTATTSATNSATTSSITAPAIGVPLLALIPWLRAWLARRNAPTTAASAKTGAIAAAATGATGVAAATAVPFSYWTLFLTFLKLGAVLYGSGYVLLAFLQGDFVHRLGWLTDRQLLDAVAIGQFTPGPVFTTATFIGYLVGGWQGALLATLAIFLPSFVFVGAIHPVATRLRRWPWTSTLLDGLNVAALALMAAVAVQLGLNALVDLITIALAIIALIVLLRFKINSAWLILGGALIGLAAHLVGLAR